MPWSVEKQERRWFKRPLRARHPSVCLLGYIPPVWAIGIARYWGRSWTKNSFDFFGPALVVPGGILVWPNKMRSAYKYDPLFRP